MVESHLAVGYTGRDTRGLLDMSHYTPVAVFLHEDGSRTEVLPDDDSQDSPRDYDCNLATMIQSAQRYGVLDEDVARLADARARWRWLDVAHGQTSCVGLAGACPCRDCRDTMPACLMRVRYDTDAMMRRYLAIFRPDVLAYVGYWTAGDSYGWGYVTRDDWEAAMVPEGAILAIDHEGPGTFGYLDSDDVYHDSDLTPAQGFAQEVETFRQWATGEVYGLRHYEPTTCRVCHVKLYPRGKHALEWLDEDDNDVCPVDDRPHSPRDEDETDSVWGLLGYDDYAAMLDDRGYAPVSA